jgi:glycosyltransferase involved in cell wall biosynthesis
MQQQIKKELEYLREPSIATMHPKMLQRFARECQQAELILLNSEVAKQTFMEAGFPAERLEVLTPPVDCLKFQPSPKTDTTFRVLYVGTIAPRKGVHYLISAFLQAQIPNSELLLVGGASTRALRILVQDTLSKHPNIKQEFWDFSRQDPKQVFGRCSILVLPSVEDGFGLVVLEAMACGLPVIVTSHCGAADVVEEGVNGFVVPPRDVNAIAEKLTLLSKNDSKRIEMGKLARITAKQHTQERYSSGIVQVFSNQRLII